MKKHNVCMPILLAVLALALLSPSRMQAQVGINTLSPDTSAILDIAYTGGGGQVGVLLPNLNDSQRNQAKGARIADGMLVFDRSRNMLYCYDSTQREWLALTPLMIKHDNNGMSDIRLTDATRNVAIGLDNAQAKLDIGGNLRVRGNTSVQGSDTIKQNLIVNGSTTLQQTLQVNGSTAVSGTTTLGGAVTVNNSLKVNGNIDAGTNTIIGNGTIPLGGIIMWSGSTLPAGWAYCNGQEVNGYRTPNLNNRFVVGVGSQYSPGATGGLSEVVLTTQQMPSHSHTARYTEGVNHSDGGSSYRPISGFEQGAVQSTGKLGNGHQGGITNNTGESQPHENRPPYYALYYIMRVQ